MSKIDSQEIALIGGALASRIVVDGTPGNWEYHPLCTITSVSVNPQIGYATRNASTNQRRTQYHYDDMLAVVIKFNGENQSRLVFDVQDVDNQAGWTSDVVGVNQAAADINAWITACCCVASTPLPNPIDISGLNQEVTQQLVLTALGSILADTTAIDANTDGLETLIQDTIDEIASFAAQNTLDLATLETTLETIKTDTAAIDANTDEIETKLDDLITNTNSIVLTTSAFEFTGAATGSSIAGVRAVMFTCTAGAPIINGLTRSTGFIITFEYDNDTMPAIPWDANTGTLQIDYIL